MARRFALPPVTEAAYEPRQIPNAARDMADTVLIRPPREMWTTLLGEMVQMVNEAVRRRASSVKDASKPLSLEYMADRLDVDDPLRGYMAFTEKEGWLQGFITSTTFTTWHRDFRWDSTNPVIDLLDHHKEGEETLPKTDEDGTLSAELQAELRAGDPDNEGVVWPTIAELSLLGALGCGRWLVEHLLAELEAPDSRYKYVVTQATDGSIAFYERMGFVRVGAVTARKRGTESASKVGAGGGGGGGDSVGNGKKRKAESPAAKPRLVCSQHIEYRVPEDSAEGESIGSIAERYDVEMHDLLFLNKPRSPKLHEESVLKAGAKLLIPQPPTVEQALADATACHEKWHVVEEDVAFKTLATETLHIDPHELHRINKGIPELKGLQVSSELRKGAKLLVDDPSKLPFDFDEYCHWTFADDDPNKSEPSYMMALRLRPLAKRAADAAMREEVIAKSEALLVPERPVVVPSGRRATFIKALEEAKAEADARQKEWANSAWHVVKEDISFKKEADALGVDPKYLRDLNKDRLKGLQLSSLLRADTWLQTKPLEEVPAADGSVKVERPHLVNRVVQIDGEDDYEFWYCLTYLPDLQWCHVAPLEKRGVFGDTPGPTGHLAEGKPCWMLVSEEEGGEIDVGAGRCHMMQALEMKGTKANADKEEWDIVCRAPPGWVHPLLPGQEEKAKGKGKKAKQSSGSFANGSAAGAGASGGLSEKEREKELAKLLARECNACKTALRQIMKHRDAGAFFDPVDWEALGLDDYPTIVTQPMDLSTVQSRLEAGAYAGPTLALDVAADIALIWSNALLYNPEGNWVSEAALAMQAVAEAKLAPIVAAARARNEPTPPPAPDSAPDITSDPPAEADAPLAATPASAAPEGAPEGAEGKSWWKVLTK